MVSGFDELEQTIMADMRKIYSEMVIEHFLNPRNLGELPQADGSGRITGPCGDTMEIYLRVKDGKITETAFWTDGCGTTIAAGSMITELAKEKSIAEAQRITQEDVLGALEGLPEENVHCAVLAANTLREAIRDYLALKSEPWKRAYRKL